MLNAHGPVFIRIERRCKSDEIKIRFAIYLLCFHYLYSTYHHKSNGVSNFQFSFFFSSNCEVFDDEDKKAAKQAPHHTQPNGREQREKKNKKQNLVKRMRTRRGAIIYRFRMRNWVGNACDDPTSQWKWNISQSKYFVIFFFSVTKQLLITFQPCLPHAMTIHFHSHDHKSRRAQVAMLHIINLYIQNYSLLVHSFEHDSAY